MTERIGRLKKRPVLTAFGLASFILMAVPLFYIISRISAVPEYRLTVVFVVPSLVLDVVRLFLGEKDGLGLLTLVSVLLKALAFSFFALGGVLSVADYVANIHLFGDSSQFPAIMAFGAVLLLGTVTSVVQCFIK